MYIPVQYSPKACSQCGTVFTPKNKNSTCCSKRCYWRAREASRDKRHREWRPVFRGPFTCACCGQSYKTARPKGEGEKYCSRECAFEARKARPKTPTASKCVCCGAEYIRKHGALYCSEQCRKRVAADKSREYSAAKKTVYERQCAQCGQAFWPEYGDKRRVFCSDKCAKADKDEQSLAALKAPQRRKETRRKRKARLRGAIVDRQAVFERDGYICRICGEPVDTDAEVPAHRAPTIDHIIPLMHGGKHSEENCQCAHFICNVRKAGKIVA